MVQASIIEQIKIRRKNLNITQSMLADLSGVSLHTISDMESGKGNPTIDVIFKIADTLGLEMNIAVKRNN